MPGLDRSLPNLALLGFGSWELLYHFVPRLPLPDLDQSSDPISIGNDHSHSFGAESEHPFIHWQRDGTFLYVTGNLDKAMLYSICHSCFATPMDVCVFADD